MSNITIPALVSTATIADADFLMVNQSGLSRKATVAVFLSNVRTDINTLSNSLNGKLNAVNIALINDRTATIAIINQNIVSNSLVLAQQLNVVNVTLNNTLAASVSTLNQAIISNSAVLAQQITTVSSQVGAVSGCVTVLTSSVNGINNTWAVTLDSNGYVSGVSSINKGNIASFNVRADKFTLSKAGSNSNVTAFSIDLSTNPPTLQFLGKINANSITSGSLASSNLYVGGPVFPSANYFAIEGTRQRLTLRDGNNKERIRLGYLNNNAPGTDPAAYGLNVYDRGGNIIVAPDGIGVNQVYPSTMLPGTTAVGYGSWRGDGSSLLSAPLNLATFSVTVGTAGEGVMIMTSGMFTSTLAYGSPPPVPPSYNAPPPVQVPPYTPPLPNKDIGEGGGGDSGPA